MQVARGFPCAVPAAACWWALPCPRDSFPIPWCVGEWMWLGQYEGLQKNLLWQPIVGATKEPSRRREKDSLIRELPEAFQGIVRLPGNRFGEEGWMCQDTG